MTTADRKLWVVFNGEIYNYLELRETLRGHGHRFLTASDTEVILHAYRQWGLEAFDRFNGMWGLGLFDVDTQTLVLSRDRVGIKPLYLHQSPQRLLFGSEVKALLSADPALAQLDRTSVARFLMRPALAYGRATFFRDIVALEPGTTMTVTAAGQKRTRRYWTFQPSRHVAAISAEAAAEQVQAALTDAIRLRFRSDAPVGTCLSGGIDSSSIVSVAKKRLGQAPDTFSAVYEERAFAEGHFVRAMVDALSLSSHEVRPDGSDLDAVLQQATYYQESAVAGPGVYTQWHVMELAHGKVKVLLDGQGGDELFAGYPRYYAPLVRSLIERGRFRTALSSWRSIRAAGADDPLVILAGYAAAKIKRRLGLQSAPVAAPLITPELAGLIKPERSHWGVPRITGDVLTDTLWDTVVRTSLPYLLHHEDRNAMAFSLEARVPFLDHHLIELAFSLPNEHKLRGAETKAVLRDAMAGILPEVVRQRRDKMGFPTPFALWTRAPEHRAWLEDLVRTDRGFVTPAAVDEALSRHDGGLLYRLATLELFCRRFIDGPFEPEPRPSWAVEDQEPR